MSKENNGGPAFPCETPNEIFSGLTMRDYFAAKAMQAMLANNEYLKAVDGVSLRHGERDHAPTLANAAYNYADAILKARDQK